MKRSWWFLLGYAFLWMSAPMPAVSASAPSPTSSLGATLSVSYKFRNGDRISDSLNGYICVQCSDPSLVPTGEGHEVLTVHVTDPGGTGSPGHEVSVRITAGLQNFYFQGSPSTIEMTNITDGAGDATFNFAAQLNLGAASMTIGVSDAGFSQDAVGSSFKMIPTILSSSVSPSVLEGGAIVTGFGPNPPGSGPGQFHLAGASIDSFAGPSNKDPEQAQEGKVLATADFKITETPVTPKADSAMFFKDIRINQYTEFSSVQINKMSASVKNDKQEADAGIRVEIQTFNVDGIPAQYNFPETNFTFFGVQVPQGVIGPGKIVKSANVSPRTMNIGPATGAGTVFITFFRTATVTYNVYARAHAIGNNAFALVDIDNLFSELQAVPQRPDDLFGP